MHQRVSYDHPFPGKRIEHWEGDELLWVEYVPDPLVDQQAAANSRRKSQLRRWFEHAAKKLSLQK